MKKLFAPALLTFGILGGGSAFAQDERIVFVGHWPESGCILQCDPELRAAGS